MGKLSRLETEWNRLSELTSGAIGEHIDKNLLRPDLRNFAMFDLSASVAPAEMRLQSMRLAEALLGAAAQETRPASPIGVLSELRLALDKPIELEASVIAIEELTVKLKKASDFNGRIRFPRNLNAHQSQIQIGTSKMPLGSWLQEIADDVTDLMGERQRYDFYVRDYGLQLATKDTAAPGAVLLSEFWKTAKPDAAKK
jgi:hypothetical protein